MAVYVYSSLFSPDEKRLNAIFHAVFYKNNDAEKKIAKKNK